MTETTMTDELHSVAAYFIGAPGDETDQRIRQIFENHGGEFIHEGGPWRKPPAPSSTSEPSKEREVVYEVAATEIDAVETELKTAGVNEVVC